MLSLTKFFEITKKNQVNSVINLSSVIKKIYENEKITDICKLFGTRKAEVLNSLIINTTTKANDTTDNCYAQLCTEDDNSCYRNVCKMSVVSFALAVVFIICKLFRANDRSLSTKRKTQMPSHQLHAFPLKWQFMKFRNCSRWHSWTLLLVSKRFCPNVYCSRRDCKLAHADLNASSQSKKGN